jgi:aminoglycoside 3-N-acetyltransferase
MALMPSIVTEHDDHVALRTLGLVSVTVEVGGCSAGFPQLPAEVDGLIQTITVGQSTWQLLPARATLERATAAIRANPTITQCGDPTCVRCTDAVAGGPVL